jgi:hypothetical protein
MADSEALDVELFASLSGGQSVIDWFGFCPTFHDGALERLEIEGGNAVLVIRTFRMIDQLDATGLFILDRHALVTLYLRGVTGLRLEGDTGSIMGHLIIRRVESKPSRDEWVSCGGPSAGDLEVTFDTAVGLFGSMFAKEVELKLDPLTGPGSNNGLL